MSCCPRGDTGVALPNEPRLPRPTGVLAEITSQMGELDVRRNMVPTCTHRDDVVEAGAQRIGVLQLLVNLQATDTAPPPVTFVDGPRAHPFGWHRAFAGAASVAGSPCYVGVGFPVGLLSGVDLVPVGFVVGPTKGRYLRLVSLAVGPVCNGPLPPMGLAPGPLLGADFFAVGFQVGPAVGCDPLLIDFPVGSLVGGLLGARFLGQGRSFAGTLGLHRGVSFLGDTPPAVYSSAGVTSCLHYTFCEGTT